MTETLEKIAQTILETLMLLSFLKFPQVKAWGSRFCSDEFIECMDQTGCDTEIHDSKHAQNITFAQTIQNSNFLKYFPEFPKFPNCCRGAACFVATNSSNAW